ncbi:MAG: hypothetical protein QOH67_3959 [Hyphomicrobiales bacterium]|jgi:hypothetical protein|nr:hypothetical protein [Hyphomicrobiales bacterium]
MTVATFHTPSAAPEVPVERAPVERKPGLLARFFEAMAEARMRQAVRELARHPHLVPEDMLKKYGYTATVSDDGAFPFTR